MNFIYPLGDGSVWNDNELKISIALLRKFTSEAKIFVVGEKPRCDIECIYIKNQIEGSRYQKSMSNVLKGLEVVGEPFVLMNDEFFCNKPFETIPLYWDMTVKERMTFASSIIYRRFLERSTGELNYAVHKPMPVDDIGLFKDMAKKAIERNCSVRILYGNEHKKNSKQEKDIKLKNIGPIGDWFSIGDSFLTPENKLWLKSLTQDIIVE